MLIRYIRDYLNGSSSNSGNHWVKIQAYPVPSSFSSSPAPIPAWSSSPASLTVGKTVSSSGTRAYGGAGSDATLTDSSAPNTSNYIAVDGTPGVPQWIQIDLGADIDVSYIQIWHYWADGRTYSHQLQVASSAGFELGQWLTVQPWAWGKPESASGRSFSLATVSKATLASNILGSSTVAADAQDKARDVFIQHLVQLISNACAMNGLPNLSINVRDNNGKIEVADLNSLITALNSILPVGVQLSTKLTGEALQSYLMTTVLETAWKVQQSQYGNTCNGSTCAGGCVSSCTTYCGNATCGKGCGAGCASACGSNCSHACGTGCYHACGSGCSSGCGSGCAHACGTGSCSTSCGGNCLSTCGGNTCGVNCGTACAGGCIGSCGGGCGNACSQRCEGCSGACDGQWAGGRRACVKHTCEGSCQNSCHTWCGGVCSTNGCSNTCTNYCSGTCSGDGCVATCAGACGTVCTGGCAGACGGGCAGACAGGCANTCAGGCANDCGGGCSSSCAGGCLSACTGFCQSACTTSCAGGCANTCASISA